MSVDPELVELLELSGGRAVDAVAALTRRIDQIREDLTADRRRDDERLGRIEASIADLRRETERIDRRCGALVFEEEGDDGETVVRARPARVGLDWKMILGLAVTLVTILASSPVLIEILK